MPNTVLESAECFLRETLFHGGRPAMLPETERVVAQIAGEEGLWPLLKHLRREAPAFSTDFHSALNRFDRIASFQEEIRHQTLLPLWAAWAGERIPFLVLKGTALAYGYYARSHHRTRTDTDILVASGAVDSARETLRGVGFQRLAGPEGEWIRKQEIWVREVEGQKVFVDLHWNLFEPVALRKLWSFESLWEASVRLDMPSGEVRTLGRRDAIVHHCLHALGHHAGETSWLWDYDFFLMTKELSSSEIGALRSWAQTKGILSVLESYWASFSARAHLASPWPGVSSTPLERIFLPLLRPRDWKEKIAWDFSALPDWPSRWRYVKELVFPPRAYLAAAFPHLWWPAAWGRRGLDALNKYLRRE